MVAIYFPTHAKVCFSKARALIGLVMLVAIITAIDLGFLFDYKGYCQDSESMVMYKMDVLTAEHFI